MTDKLITQDLVITIAAKGLNPAIINPDILKYSGVIPIEWELVRPAVHSNKSVQMAFTNGINVIGEMNRVMFAEPLTDKSSDEILVADLAKRYAESLPNLEFKGISIDIRGYISAEDAIVANGNFVPERLLADGAWREEGMRASVNLVYPGDRAPLFLNIMDAVLKKDDETTQPIVLFNGRFNYELDSESTAERLDSLRQALVNLSADRARYSELITRKFLEQPTSAQAEAPYNAA